MLNSPGAASTEPRGGSGSAPAAGEAGGRTSATDNGCYHCEQTAFSGHIRRAADAARLLIGAILGGADPSAALAV